MIVEEGGIGVGVGVGEERELEELILLLAGRRMDGCVGCCCVSCLYAWSS
jgi:hypothetical protein